MYDCQVFIIIHHQSPLSLRHLQTSIQLQIVPDGCQKKKIRTALKPNTFQPGYNALRRQFRKKITTETEMSKEN